MVERMYDKFRAYYGKDRTHTGDLLSGQGEDLTVKLHNHIRRWDPDVRNAFTLEEAQKILNGQDTKPLSKTILEVNLRGSALTFPGQQVVRLVDDISERYFRLYSGEKHTQDINTPMYASLGITISGTRELQALKDIFTGREVDSVLNGSRSRKKIIKEVKLDDELQMEEKPRAARLIRVESDFFLLIGEKRVLDGKPYQVPRGLYIDRGELPAFKSLFENLSIKK